MMKFMGHKYQYTNLFGPRHHWELRGPHGGIHLSVNVSRSGSSFGDSAGLEYHRAFDPTGGKQAPSHVDCPVAGGACWHDGTSLYASDTLWPMIKPMLADGDHEAIFKVLEHEYDEHFSQYRGSDSEGAA